METEKKCNCRSGSIFGSFFDPKEFHWKGENIVELRILEELLEDKSATFLIMIGHLINDLFVWMRSFVALNVGEELSLSIFFQSVFFSD